MNKARNPRAVPIPKPLEKDVQRQILDYLTILGGWPVRINSGAMKGTHAGKRWFMRMNSQPGCPDILVCLVSRFIAIEVKRPGGKPTDVQLVALEAVTKAGGLAFVADSVEAVAKALRLEGLIE